MLKLSMILFILFGLHQTPGVDLEHKEKISKTFTFESAGDHNILIIKNINGSIRIEGTQANQVSVVLEKVIEAKSQKELEEGIRDITLGSVSVPDSIILFTDSPFAILERRNGKVHYRWENDHDDINYNFRFNYTVSIPYGTMLDISNINQGDVRIIDTRSVVSASNVNGSVYLEKTSAVRKVSSVNGTVECEITKKPTSNCFFNTVNGDIKILTPSNLSADVSYHAMHGDFYTDYEIEVLPYRSESIRNAKEGGTEYRIEKDPQFRIGDGAVSMRFTTINGDMILRSAKSNL
jgi:hypothetical protein